MGCVKYFGGLFVLGLSLSACKFKATATQFGGVQAPPANSKTDTVQVQDYDATGWTLVKRSADTRDIFVSSTYGNDNFDGLSAERPVRSLRKGVSLLRNNSADHLLLKRGDVWSGQSLSLQSPISGRSHDEPIVIATYGDATAARPLIDPRGDHAVGMWASVEHLRLIGVDGYQSKRDPTSANFVRADFDDKDNLMNRTQGLMANGAGPYTDILVEDCRFRFFNGGIAFYDLTDPARFNDIRIRRNVIENIFPRDASSGAQGISFAGVKTLLVEGNLLNQIGFYPALGIAQNVYSRGIYAHTDMENLLGDYRVYDNLLLNISSKAIEFEGGGDIQGNICYRANGCATGSAVDASKRDSRTYSVGTLANLIGNASFEGQSGTIPLVIEFGLTFVGRAKFQENIVSGIGVKNTAFASFELWKNWGSWIEFDWDKNIVTGRPAGTFFQGEPPDDVDVLSTGFPDAARNLASYNQSLGGAADTTAFYQRARANWFRQAGVSTPELLNYIREGFALPAFKRVQD